MGDRGERDADIVVLSRQLSPAGTNYHAVNQVRTMFQTITSFSSATV